MSPTSTYSRSGARRAVLAESSPRALLSWVCGSARSHPVRSDVANGAGAKYGRRREKPGLAGQRSADCGHRLKNCGHSADVSREDVRSRSVGGAHSGSVSAARIGAASARKDRRPEVECWGYRGGGGARRRPHHRGLAHRQQSRVRAPAVSGYAHRGGDDARPHRASVDGDVDGDAGRVCVGPRARSAHA